MQQPVIHAFRPLSRLLAGIGSSLRLRGRQLWNNSARRSRISSWRRAVWAVVPQTLAAARQPAATQSAATLSAPTGGRHKHAPRQRVAAMTIHEIAIVHEAERFSHRDASRIFDIAMRSRPVRTVVIDLNCAGEATTSAFAHLVLLRRYLLRRGRDLRIIGLRDRAAHLYEINRLASVLPSEPALQAA